MAAEKQKVSEDEANNLFDLVEKNRVEDVQKLLSNSQGTPVDVNAVDDHGMTALDHAAYRGKAELVDLLLAHGADVNSHQHEHGYTSLMFAAISGKAEVVVKILAAGGNPNMVNSLGRTASQMAGFVGNHQCVAAIANFIPRSVVEYYTVCHGQQKEPLLPKPLVSSLHKLLINSNFHPVSITIFLIDTPELAKESARVLQVLDRMISKELESREANEITIFKLHYLSYILTQFVKETENPENLIKRLLKGRQEDNFPEFMERFLRQCIREFPYTQLVLLTQLAKTLATVTIGEDPTAYMILDSAFNGQRALYEHNPCATCGVLKAEKRCSVCKTVPYCSKRCQKYHWFNHKKECPELAKDFQEKPKDEGEGKEKSKQNGSEEQNKGETNTSEGADKPPKEE